VGEVDLKVSLFSHWHSKRTEGYWVLYAFFVTHSSNPSDQTRGYVKIQDVP